MSLSKRVEYIFLSSFKVVISYLSCPVKTSVTYAISFTFLANTPMWSREEANANSPYLDILPYVGLKPTIPPNAAGFLTESPVSDPIANGTKPNATAEALPADEPPIYLVESQGFLSFPVWPVVPVPPIANSSKTVFPTNTAPLSFNFL